MVKDISNKVLNHALFPWGICLLTFVTKLPFLNYRGIWADEAFTLFHSQESLKEIWSLSLGGPNPPVFMFIIHFWIKLVGITAAWVRIIPLLFHALTAGLLFKIGKIASGNRVGLFASGLFLFSFEHFYFAFEIRTYSLVCLCTAVSLYYYIRLRDGFNITYIFLVFLSNLVHIYSHYFGWFVVLNELLFLFFIIKEKRSRFYLLGSFVLLLLCYLPLLKPFYEQLIHVNESDWSPVPNHRKFLNEIRFFLNDNLMFLTVLYVLIMGVVVKSYYLLTHRDNFRGTLDAEKLYNILFLFLWFFIPYLCIYIVGRSIPVFLERYVLFCTIGLYLFIALCADYLYQEYAYLKWVTMIGMIGMSCYTMNIYRKDFYYREVRESVAYAKKHIEPGTRIVVYPYWAYQEFMYYYDQEAFRDPGHLLENLSKHSIYPVWHWGMIRDAMALDTAQYSQLILFQDCGEQDPEIGDVRDYLRKTHTALDSAFFPQTFKVTVFWKSNN